MSDCTRDYIGPLTKARHDNSKTTTKARHGIHDQKHDRRYPATINRKMKVSR